jgi:glucose 1-dehydrogenase
MVEKHFEDQLDPEKTRNEIYRMHPLGRIAETKDIANAAIFFASEESSFITGTTLVVDGGLLSYFQ